MFPFLGTAFIPEMKEGSVVPGINRVPNISLDESIKMEMQAMKLVMEVPGVKSAISGVGRGESPADPRARTSRPHREPQAARRVAGRLDPGRHHRRHAREAQGAARRPGGDGPADLRPGGRDGHRRALGRGREGVRRRPRPAQAEGRRDRPRGGRRGRATDIRVERITGQQYLSVEIDRAAIARHGLNVSDVNDVIEAAIGGKQATEVYEGERRFASVVRLPESFRDNVEKIGNVLVTPPAACRWRWRTWPTSASSMARRRSPASSPSAAWWWRST
jgi:cobalt-zinc-cadmium resistance protein CzcA